VNANPQPMEKAMSQRSNGPKCRHRRLPDAPRITSANAPSASLPLRFIVFGLVALGIAGGWLVAHPSLITQYHYGPEVIAFTHLVLLGFAASVVMGVLYQLTPVALEARLHSERLARWHWWMHVLGVTGMVWMFRHWDMKQVGHYGSVFGLGVFFFVYNMVRTLARVPRWTPVAFGVASGVGWLLITMLVGLFVACAKCWPWLSPFAPLAQMHAHAHLGVVGIFILLTVAVSYRIVPMFAISSVQSTRRAWWSIALLNAGVAGIVTTILLESAWRFAAALTIIAGLTLYGLEIRAILRARMRAALDWGMRSFLTGIAMLAPLSIIALVLCWPGLPATPHTYQCENVYAVLGIFGVLWLSILGMLGKILPFFVWFHRYSDDIGRQPVPQLAEMYSTKLQAWGYWLHLAGLAGMAGAAATQFATLGTASCILLAASVLTFLINAASILSHLRRRTQSPDLPLGVAPASS
jgi:hypothetical protein